MSYKKSIIKKGYNNKNKYSRKFNNENCDDNMTFQDCELAILRSAVDEGDKIKGQRLLQNEDVKEIITIVENFIRRKKVICYGGTAINNILPKNAQFYNLAS